jgi:hypothetical protein
VRQASEWGASAPLEPASAAFTDAFLLVAIDSDLRKHWAESFPEPRAAPEMAREVLVPAPRAARFAGLYTMRTAGDVWRAARV